MSSKQHAAPQPSRPPASTRARTPARSPLWSPARMGAGAVGASDPGDPSERRADGVADQLLEGRGAGPALSGQAGAAAPSRALGVSPAWRRSLEERVEAGGEALLDAARWGHSFADIRVHSDEPAARLCQEVGASAFTFGREIFFGRDRFRPGTPEGRRLIAHELAHTLQARPFPFVQRQPDHVVQPGEGLFGIARRYGCTVDELRAANRAIAARGLQPGDVLHIPPRRHTVGPNDTLFSLSRQYGVTVQQIQAANRLRGTTIRNGAVLLIPRTQVTATPGTQQQPAPPGTQRPPAPPPTQQQPAPPGTQQQPAPPGTQQQPAPPGTQQQPTPPGTQQQPAAAPSAAPPRGHLPGQDYTSGTVRERSFLRGPDLTTIQSSGGGRVFFERGTRVTMLGVHPQHPEWIRVTGSAVAATRPGPTPITAPQTGWIQRQWTDMTLGVFRDLAVTDRTQQLGALSQSNLLHGSVRNIVLHRTDASTQQSTLRSYEDRIQRGSDIGAQFLIGETGEISVITGLNRYVSHVAPDLPSGANAHVTNPTSIGIEHTGRHVDIAPAPRPPPRRAPRARLQAWARQMARVRTDLDRLSFSPQLRERLMSMDDRQLFQAMSATRWQVYPDINGPQRRSSFLLTQRLRQEFGRGQGDIYAHESAQAKALGEGENIREFLVAREAYPTQVQALRNIANTRQDLQQTPAFMNVLTREEALVQALAADATAAENTALATERASRQAGPATARETARTRFYDDFWGRNAQMNELLSFLRGPDRMDLNRLAPLLARWRS